jgi:hypothetical protein
MLNRAPAYEWDWEHFIIEYFVFDACWKSAVELKLVPEKDGRGNRITHRERINWLCAKFNLQHKTDIIREIVNLRNDLFHEALWDRGQPGTASTSGSFFSPLHLRRFNQRLVLALLGYENDYMRSSWWTMGISTFGIP